ncbi:type II toxin-antitoxin system ChpB family toxin [Thiothrix eikelboomii]|uniref:type II toxin-antitoxin system ChpB family toxin n=1 Tax=Thiothrix eikelboomii TaxID=92487 RepID=UPI003BAFA091
MVSRSGFQRGDIVRVNLNPTVGRELQGEMRPALVVSEEAFNQLTGTPLVLPITQGGNLARLAGFTVPLMGSGTETQGVILVHAIRLMDLQGRGAKKVETVPESIMDEVLAKLAGILGLDE